MEIEQIVSHFCFEGDLRQVEPFGSGHINDTLRVTMTGADGAARRYVLQRINHFVFKNPALVMENIEQVTAHLRRKILSAGGDPRRETLNLVRTREGGLAYQTEGGETWRAFWLIEGARTYESAISPQQLYQAAWAFGNFQRQLADFPAERLHETIPNFHNTPLRFRAFQQAVQDDARQRAAAIGEEIDFLLAREAQAHVLVDLLKEGALPLRVTHNDTKFNNVMIDDQSGRAICILDLDTVMPGLALYDFGDAVRSAAATVAEDSPDAAAAGIDLKTFDSLAHGYLDAARDFLTPAEIDHLAFAARLITFEQALRFLGDYLNGDIYYKVQHPLHNLQRARTQIGMVRDMESHFEQMQAIITQYR